MTTMEKKKKKKWGERLKGEGSATRVVDWVETHLRMYKYTQEYNKLWQNKFITSPVKRHYFKCTL